MSIKDDWIKKKQHVYSKDYLLNHRKNETLPSVTTWMDIEGVVLSSVSQRKTNATRFHLRVESKQDQRTNKTNRLI